MANIKGIHGDPIGAIKHNLRERTTYRNEDIDPERSDQNYVLESHGKDSGQVYSYYRSLVDRVYHRWKSTITTFDTVVTKPDDLPDDKTKEFFQSATKFIKHYYYQGDSKQVLLAVVHVDEGVQGGQIGRVHEHIMGVLPQCENKNYISPRDKMAQGLQKIKSEFGIIPTEEQLRFMCNAISAYERDGDINQAIHDFADCLGLERDEARKALLRCKRTEKERYEKRLMAKDEFITREKLEDFHIEFQKWIDEHGPKCTVYQGGGTISIPVEKLKEMTRETGVTLDHGITPRELGEMIKLREHARKIAELHSREQEIELGE